LGCGGGPDADEIVIGHYASLTGSEATFGRSSDNGVKMAIEEINAAGGIKGKRVRLVTYDDKGENREAGTAVTRLITRDRVVAVLGEVASGRSLAAAPICQEHGVPMVSTSSTNPRVTTIGDKIFRICYIDPFQGWACAKFAREHEQLKAQKAAILFNQAEDYSVGLKDEFEKAFVKLGGAIVAKESYQTEDQDYSAQLVSIRGSRPDVIFIPGYYTDAANIALRARELGIEAPILGGDGWDSAMLAEIGGKAIEGSYYSNHYSHEDPNPRVQDFIRKWKEEYGQVPDGTAALGYDAARILFDAIERAPSLSGGDLAAALAATRDFDGVTGRISIDANRNAVKSIVVVQMRNGMPRFVTRIEPREE
jgi:branched-chain amino acid transport system substrate-binding protein